MLGATGHVGRLLRAAPVPEFSENAVWHSRTGTDADWGWDILNEDPSDVAFDAVLHLARGGSLAQEVEVAQRVCELARGRPVLFASSQAVYGAQDGPIAETAPLRPNNLYGEAKAAAEEIISAYSNGLSLRIGNVAGADMVFKAMAAGAVVLDQFEDGTGPRRSYIGPCAFAAAVAILCDKMANGSMTSSVLNFANPGTVAMSDCLDQAGADWEWQTAPASALRCLELDTSKLQAIVPLNQADAQILVAEARASGWRPYNDAV